MAAACTCFVNHLGCCGSRPGRNPLEMFQKFSPTTRSLRLQQSRKKNAGEKSFKFFEKGMFAIFTLVSSQRISTLKHITIDL